MSRIGKAELVYGELLVASTRSSTAIDAVTLDDVSAVAADVLTGGPPTLGRRRPVRRGPRLHQTPSR